MRTKKIHSCKKALNENLFIVNPVSIVGSISLNTLTYSHQLLSVASHINCIAAHCLINFVYLMACAFIRS